MNILSKAFQEITFEDVVASCKAGTLESSTLEYKKIMPSDLSKHFATFSNTYGGLIIIGVEEDTATGTPKHYDGIVFDGKLVDQVHQFATNVSPFPRYEVRPTNEVNGRVFLLIKILEGDQPPYTSNNDSTVRLRTGNISTPLRNADSRELDKLYEKRSRASAAREDSVARSNIIHEAAVKRAVEEWKLRKKDDPRISDNEPDSLSAPYRVTIMPISPTDSITDYRLIKDRLNDYRVQSRYLGDFPDLNIETIPGGIMFANWSWTDGRFSYGGVTEKGMIDSIEDILNASLEKNTRQIWMGQMIGYLVRQLDVAKKFYNLVGFNGLLNCKITLADALGVSVFAPKPDGWQHSAFDRGSQLTKLGTYEWEIANLDTVKLNNLEALVEEVLETVERFYWDFGMGAPNKEMVKDYLRQLGWPIPKEQV